MKCEGEKCMRKNRAEHEVRNIYLYNEMKRLLDNATEEVKEKTVGNAFVSITRKVEILSVLRGMKYWDQEKDIYLLASAIDNLSYLKKDVPEKKKDIAEEIVYDILKIKNLEEEEKTDRNAQTIKFWIKKTLKDLEEFKK